MVRAPAINAAFTESPQLNCLLSKPIMSLISALFRKVKAALDYLFIHWLNPCRTKPCVTPHVTMLHPHGPYFLDHPSNYHTVSPYDSCQASATLPPRRLRAHSP